MNAAILIGLIALAGAPAGGKFRASADYPLEAVRNRWEGTARFTATIGPDGKAVACRITTSSGHDVLDRATCDLVMRRARFEPARDSAGKPITAEFHNKVTWKLP